MIHDFQERLHFSEGVEVGACVLDHLVKLVPGGSLILIAPNADGYAVAAGTGDLLKVGNDDGAAAASYSIFILGSQA